MMNFKPLFYPIIFAGLFINQTATAEITVIELTQVPCQFLEVEEEDFKFISNSKKDCEKINARTGNDRLMTAKTLKLEQGDYIFRVTNKNVPYPLGFYLRPVGLLDRLTLTTVSGGGIETGQTHDYTIHLLPGEYKFSCPLNPTLDYKISVTR